MTSPWGRALTLLFPHKCFLCERVLAGEGWLCGECALPETAGEACPGCGKRRDRCVCEGSGSVCGGVSAALSGERVLLVDDVLTTGATARRCAELLKRAGAGEVFLAVAATTPAGQRKIPPKGARR